MNTRYLVNGEPIGVDPGDRGLAYGDGLFETMAAVDGAVPRLELHLERLIAGCERLEIQCPPRASLERDLGRLVPRSGRCVVKIIVTRGSGARGYAPPAQATPTRIVSTSPWPSYPEALYTDGIRVRVCALKLGMNPAMAGLKHLGRLEYVLAQLELRGADVEQGLLCDVRDLVVGGTSSNVFVVKSGAIRTPALTHAGVRGVMRRVVLTAARELGLHVDEVELTLDDVFAADEVFMTNAVFGIWPVQSIDTRLFDVGPIAQLLLARLGFLGGR
jgi:4-amino-4-deoxychorismate lyase